MIEGVLFCLRMKSGLLYIEKQIELWYNNFKRGGGFYQKLLLYRG